MKYLLDTNACIAAMSGRLPKFMQRFLAVKDPDKIVCAIVRAELFYGAYKSQNPQQRIVDMDTFLMPYPNLDFDELSARRCGEIRADLARKGTPIGPNDVQIAGIGLAHNLIVVTHNTREFSRVHNLQLEDWEI
jgi:tRNA(fMet)-specific endonuclease VapC